jgi:hypothetical protein
VRVVRNGLEKPWWKPLDADLRKTTEKPTETKPPIAGSRAETGEGTRYGKRPRMTKKAHAKPARKPQQ